MDIFSNHIKLFATTFLLFTGLSIVVAVLPAIENQNNNGPLPGSRALSDEELAGKFVFISNGCIACHTQQVRNVEMDKAWGSRPGIAADFAGNTRMTWWMNTATLMGTERTGPDLTNIGKRLPGEDWHLLHLYNPRAVVEQSIMPSYPWMFDWKEVVTSEDKVVSVPVEFSKGNTAKLVAGKEALQLVAYLRSLKQTPLPTSITPSIKSGDLDGALLYANNCQACHQPKGEGLRGAFPSLKRSSIVLDDDPEIMIEIIMNGYNAREEYGEMPPVGVNNQLTAGEVAAIVTYVKNNIANH